MGAVHQHRQTFARQQQRQQRGQHRQLARAVVAGQHDQGALGGGDTVQAGVCSVQKTRHFFAGLPLDPHGKAERTDFQVGDGAVQHLAEQVGGLRARERLCATRATPDFLDVLRYSHREGFLFGF